MILGIGAEWGGIEEVEQGMDTGNAMDCAEVGQSSASERLRLSFLLQHLQLLIMCFQFLALLVDRALLSQDHSNLWT